MAKDQGVAAAIVGLDVKEAIKIKAQILAATAEIKEQQIKKDGKSSIKGGVYAGPSKKILTGQAKKEIVDKSKE